MGGEGCVFTTDIFCSYFQVCFYFGDIGRLYPPSHSPQVNACPPCGFNLRDKVLGKFSSERAQEIKGFLKYIVLNGVQAPVQIILFERACLSHLSGLAGDLANGSPAGVSQRGCCLGPPCKGEISPQALSL